MSESEQIVSAVKRWFDGLQAGIGFLSEEIGRHEHIVHIQPNNPLASAVELRFGSEDFGLYLDGGFAIESLPLDEVQVLDICDSVRRGRLHQQRWEFRGKLIGSRSVLHLSAGRIWDRYGGRGWPFHYFTFERTIHYEPWDLSIDRN